MIKFFEVAVAEIQKILSKLFTRQAGPTPENGIYKPLKLNLQFFADPDEDLDDPEDKKNEKKDKKDPDKKSNPDNKTDLDEDNPEDEKPTLKSLFKKHPELKEQYSDKFQQDFNKRLKGLDIEEARKAVELLEKLGINADGKEKDDKQEDKKSDRTSKLEQKAKDLSFKLYVAGKGLDADLVSELASRKVGKLELNEDGELDQDELDEIIDDLEERFPQIFTAKEDANKSDKKDSSYTPGGRQKTNPPPGKKDVREKVEERFNRVRGPKK